MQIWSYKYGHFDAGVYGTIVLINAWVNGLEEDGRDCGRVFFLTFFVFSPRNRVLLLVRDPAMLLASWEEGAETKVSAN